MPNDSNNPEPSHGLHISHVAALAAHDQMLAEVGSIRKTASSENDRRLETKAKAVAMLLRTRLAELEGKINEYHNDPK